MGICRDEWCYEGSVGSGWMEAVRLEWSCRGSRGIWVDFLQRICRYFPLCSIVETKIRIFQHIEILDFSNWIVDISSSRSINFDKMTETQLQTLIRIIISVAEPVIYKIPILEDRVLKFQKSDEIQNTFMKHNEYSELSSTLPYANFSSKSDTSLLD